ncbi:hypothetical protein EDD85DRAFT_925870 [Armillaria nabsnona]|nr:hypothetical protein EDD85DRAFT_925870 [Armillaria nabsnona]
MEAMSLAIDPPSTPRALHQPQTSSIYDRRLLGPHRHLSVSIRQDSDFDGLFDQETPVVLAKDRQSRRPTTCGFLPLPSISASPVCTPTTSISSRDFDVNSSSSGTDGYITAPPTPASLKLAFTPPTWISIPPTPPPKLFRRSVTCVARRPPISPSASLPAADSRNGKGPKRCASVPSMSLHPRSPYTQRKADVTLAANSRTPSSRPHPVFDIAHEVSSDTEDNGVGEEAENEETTLEAGSSDQGHGSWQTENLKDQVRKYHVLTELLSTEVRYLMDLRVLVTIYLRNLSTVTCRTPSSSAFGRTSSFTSASRSSSNTHLHSPLSASSGNLSDLQSLQPLTTITLKDSKAQPRYLFTNSDIELLARNAEEVLQFHENFVEEIRAALTPLGFPVESTEKLGTDLGIGNGGIDNLEACISFVSTKFATEASRFNSYEVFCAGHPEAIDIVRRVQQQYPNEWEAFEQRCSILIGDLVGTDSTPSPIDGDPTPFSPVGTPLKKRRTSVSSLEGVRTLVSRSGTTREQVQDPRRDKKRLIFLDYLIMPVQRICRYPLLLDQLKPGKVVRALSPPQPTGRSDVNVIVESAAQAMRHVATKVDEARHRHSVALQSSLIVTRISRATPVPSSAQPSSVNATSQSLTPAFLSSLGVCLLAGSLDVMHSRSYTSITNINAKYLGAFLYLGGYLILVKVVKGKVYEPKHWFRLTDFDVEDVAEDALLPCSFRLSCKGHRFELAAACQKEKDAWISSIRESLSHTSSSWINEPTSSLQFDGKGELVPSALDGPYETIHALPTIQSIPDIGKNMDQPELTATLLDTLAHDPHPSKPYKAEPAAPSRRSSTASVKAIFTPTEPDIIVIRRSSPSARLQVDHGLRDVTSEPCLAARSHATSREEELFQAPNIARPGLPRNSSGLSMTSRLKKHESVRVRRRKSTIDGSDVSQLPDKKPSNSHHRPRPNSLVSTFFRSRPSSPSSTTSKSPHDNNKSSSNSGLFKRWMKGPFHRRSRSAPEDIPPEPKPIKGSPTLPDLNFGTELRLTQSPIAAEMSI